jgi:hypothetical protein
MTSEALVIQHVGATYQRQHRYMIMTIEDMMNVILTEIEIMTVGIMNK